MDIIQAMSNAFDHVMGTHHEKMWQRYKRLALRDWTLTLIQSSNGSTDASGNLSLKVYSNVTQRRIAVGRIVITAAGITPASPRGAGATEWAGIFGGPGANYASLRDYLPTVSGGIMFPQKAEYSGHNTLRFEKTEDIYFELRNSTLTNTVINVSIYGSLEPTSSDIDF